MKAIDLITRSMKMIGALASGEVPTDSEAADALNSVNEMLDSWTSEKLTVFKISIEEFALTPLTQVYTMGPGGLFNTTRPSKIDRISIVSLTNPVQPLELPMELYTDWTWQQQPVKNIQTTLPTAVYDDGGYPLRSLSYWPIPTVPVNTRIYSWTALTQFPDLVTDINFPPGYPEAIRYNLALRLIAEMPGGYNPVMIAATQPLAVESLARIKSMNIPVIEAFCDAAITGKGARYNYYSDQPVGGRGRQP